MPKTSVPSVGKKEVRAALPAVVRQQKAIVPVDSNRGWISILESFAGAWQRNVEVKFDSVMAQHAVFACQTLIASDIAKLRVMLVEKDSDGIFVETENTAHTPVLRKPNHFQTRIQFWESWILSKLQRGNTYVLKEYDNRDVVKALYVLDPSRVQALVADTGDVFYRLSSDHLSGIEEQIVVPAEAMIHDRFNCLFHPLVGVSPIFASGLTAMQGLNIQKNATNFFENSAIPSGILMAEGDIGKEKAEELKARWEANFGGTKQGRIAVLGDKMKFERMTMTSVEAQMVEQLKWTAEIVCSTFHVPPYKIGVGTPPSYNNIQALNVEYYSQCLQVLIESAELCLDEGLGLLGKTPLGTEFDLDGLLRMDTVTQMDVLEKGKGVMTLDERRRKLDLKAVKGGNTIYLQQQDHSLEAIAARDAAMIANGGSLPTSAPKPAEPSEPAEDEDGEEGEEGERFFREAFAEIERGLNHAAH